MLHKKTELTNSMVRDFAQGDNKAFDKIRDHYEVLIHKIALHSMQWDNGFVHPFKNAVFQMLFDNREMFFTHDQVKKFLFKASREVTKILFNEISKNVLTRAWDDARVIGTECEFKKAFGSYIYAKSWN
jgi:hypothetical protein